MRGVAGKFGEATKGGRTVEGWLYSFGSAAFG